MLHKISLQGEILWGFSLAATKHAHQIELKWIKILELLARPVLQSLMQLRVWRIFLEGLLIKGRDFSWISVKCLDQWLFKAELLIASNQKLNDCEENRVYSTQKWKYASDCIAPEGGVDDCVCLLHTNLHEPSCIYDVRGVDNQWTSRWGVGLVGSVPASKTSQKIYVLEKDGRVVCRERLSNIVDDIGLYPATLRDF